MSEGADLSASLVSLFFTVRISALLWTYLDGLVNLAVGERCACVCLWAQKLDLGTSMKSLQKSKQAVSLYPYFHIPLWEVLQLGDWLFILVIM